jgi:integrase-like protein
VAERPNDLWVTDITYVSTWSGVAYVCFIVDACSRTIVGWRVAAHMRASMVVDALDMAAWSRGTRLDGPRCHSDAGPQFTTVRYGERLAELGAVPSIGTVGDSYDNALAETVNGAYKTELIRGPGQGTWKTIDRGRRARNARLGALAQHRPTALLPRRCSTVGVRRRVLGCQQQRAEGWNPIKRASITPRSIQSDHLRQSRTVPTHHEALARPTTRARHGRRASNTARRVPHHLQRSPPHRSRPQRATPSTIYHARPKASPTGRDDSHYRVRHDRVDDVGTVTLRVDGRLHHIGIGRTHARTHIILLVNDLHVRVVHAATGELLRDLTVDPARDYQPTGKPKGPTRPKTKTVRTPMRVRTVLDVSRHHMVAGAGFEPATFGL